MIYRKPAVPLKSEPGANKLFGNSSYFGLKLMFVQPATTILCGACCLPAGLAPLKLQRRRSRQVSHFNILNFVQTLNLKPSSRTRVFYKHPVREWGKFPLGLAHEF